MYFVVIWCEPQCKHHICCSNFLCQPVPNSSPDSRKSKPPANSPGQTKKKKNEKNSDCVGIKCATRTFMRTSNIKPAHKAVKIFRYFYFSKWNKCGACNRMTQNCVLLSTEWANACIRNSHRTTIIGMCVCAFIRAAIPFHSNNKEKHSQIYIYTFNLWYRVRECGHLRCVLFSLHS